jgi:LacI family transcriptional regulator
MGNSENRTSRPRAPRRGQRGPTVADVARAAGVSSMTVSRVVNHEPSVLAATRDKVNAAIAALGYVPNPAARSLAGGQQCRVALLYSNPSAAYLSEFLVGVLAEAAACNVELMLEPISGAENAQALVSRLVAHRIDAALLPPPLCEDAALLAALKAAKMPMAQIATGRPEAFAQAVTIDDEAAAHTMTARLIGLGHRRIGFIAGNPNQTASALRRAGHERALAEAGISADPALFGAGDFSYRSGLVAAERLLAQAPRPTAIFASNDDMAAAAVAAAHRLGLEVPRDVSICGFDDTAMATTIWPELTTIRQPIASMARLALSLVAEAVRADLAGSAIPPRHRRLDFELVPRASDGAPRSG